MGAHPQASGKPGASHGKALGPRKEASVRRVGETPGKAQAAPPGQLPVCPTTRPARRRPENLHR